MVLLPFTKYFLLHNHFIKKASTLQKKFRGHNCFVQFNPFLQKISTSSSNHCERLSWERSTQEILLGKLRFSLRNQQVHEAWKLFQDFRNLYGYPEVHIVNQLIVQLSYSYDHVWMRKACDLVLQIVNEKSGLLHADTLTKLALSLARLQMPAPASVILRLLLEKGWHDATCLFERLRWNQLYFICQGVGGILTNRPLPLFTCLWLMMLE